MHSRIIANQQRHFLEFMAVLRPHLRTDSALPRRIKELLGRNRSLGSRDRRLYRELIYTTLRYLPWIEPLLDNAPDDAVRVVAWLAPEFRDTQAFRASTCDGWPDVPDALAAKAAALRARYGDSSSFEIGDLLPAWFREHCPAAFEPPHFDAIQARAPLWVRMQTKDASLVLDEFRRHHWTPEPHPVVADACRLPANADVGGTDAYRRGFVEIQDLGSQLVLLHAPVATGGSWLDVCAGAGGKSLQLARLVGPTGRVDAMDIRPAILEELRDRAVRAKLANISVVQKPEDAYDGVLVDAPCSGSGTWRRQPHLKWYLTAESIPEFAATQLSILREAADRVRAGGLLVYATCSLSHMENRDVVAAFLSGRKDFSPEAPGRDWGGVRDEFGSTLLPGTHDTDGFYVAVLRRS